MLNKKSFTLLLAAIVCCFIVPMAFTQKEAPAAATVINGFTVVKLTDKTAQISVNGQFAAIEVGKFYNFPATIKSNRAQVFIQFSPDNTARLLANTVLNLASEQVRHPKLTLLTGNLALELDNFPKDHKIEVATPTAVCGAVGTRFEVSYSGEDKQLGIDKTTTTQTQSFACSKGEIYVASNSFSVGGVKRGQAVTTQAYEGQENSYCSVKLAQQPGSASFQISMPDKSTYIASATSFEIAKPKDEDMTVVKVLDNNMKTLGFFEKSEIPIQANKSYVKVGDQYIENENTEAYLAAAKEEGQLDTRIKEVNLELALLNSPAAEKETLQKTKVILEEKREEATKKASAIAKKITQDQNINRIIQGVRSHINRQQMRKVHH